MKAAWLTDIHLNFLKYNQREDFLKQLSGEKVDCFLISGDIGEADCILPFLQRIESAVKRPVYFVMGNHDFYEGSIKAVRTSVSDFLRKSDKLIWLNEVKYIGLTEKTALIGHDSWSDGRLGNFYRSTVELNDFQLIKELKLLDRAERLKAMQELADEAVEHFSKVLPLALKTYRHIEENVPVAIERSRSGNGAHAWIFFEEEVPASTARKLGSYLITKTMSKRYQMDMKSYDRLFPNQDTLPKGGLGNLIVLPFQKETSRHGNSLFIDEHCQPFVDQWAYLASIRRMSYKDVEKIAGEASKSNQIIGVRMSPVDEDDPPWMQLPSGKKRFKTNITDVPSQVEIVVANRVYIKTGSVPSILLNQLKRLAAFQNPEFYKRQSMRFSTHATPRVICCAEIVDGYLSLPRGCLEDVTSMMEAYEIQIGQQDERVTGKKIKSKFNGQLTRMQQNLAKKILKHDIGILVAPPGVGKTVMAIHAIAKRKTNVLILVHRKPLLEQWRMQLTSFLGVDIKEIGQIGSGKNNVTGNIDVAMVQSMERKGVVNDCIIDYGFVIVDECHHISAVSFERVLMQAKAKYVLGLTATPYRSDGHQPIIHMQCGPIVARIKQSQATQQISQFSVVSRMTEFQHDWTEESKITKLWPELIHDEYRNEMIVNDIIDLVKDGRFPVVLTERRGHLKIMEELIKPHVDQLTVLYGGLKSAKREETLQGFRDCPDAKSKVLLATGSYLGEGFDDPRLDTLPVFAIGTPKITF